MPSQSRKLFYFLMTVIFLEGYIVLSSEILSIRQITSFVGNGADTISIIIAAVLMPLAFGYYVGGKFKIKLKDNGNITSVRKKLIANIFYAQLFLFPALSFIGIELFFSMLYSFHVTNRQLLASIYSIFLIATPVFLLGQTVPLISNYFSTEKLSLITGKILFVSTTGSFLGSIFTTMVVMHYWGANNAVNLVFMMLSILLIILSKKKSEKEYIAITLAVIMIFLNSTYMLEKFGIVANYTYNTVSVVDTEKGKIFSLNKSMSSFLGNDGGKFPYIEYVERTYINPIEHDGLAPKKILIVGAAGFTIGLTDHYNDYTFVDIDPDIKKIAEEKFLKQKLSDNKKFIGQDIISYISTNQDKYDLIFLDAYTGIKSMPEHMITYEFFQKIKLSLNPNGILLANFVASPHFHDTFSQRLDATFVKAFPHFGRQILAKNYNPWTESEGDITNIIYSYRLKNDDMSIYTNNKNSSAFDKPDFKSIEEKPN
jgi:predicted membrane-bound spermidine synthase